MLTWIGIYNKCALGLLLFQTILVTAWSPTDLDLLLTTMMMMIRI